jgi:hypothetical protein
MELPPPHDPTAPVVALDLIDNATGGSGHCTGSGADHSPDRPSDHCASRGANRRAGGLLARGAGTGQETQGCHEHQFLHELPPTDPFRGISTTPAKLDSSMTWAGKEENILDVALFSGIMAPNASSTEISGTAASEPALACRA